MGKELFQDGQDGRHLGQLLLHNQPIGFAELYGRRHRAFGHGCSRGSGGGCRGDTLLLLLLLVVSQFGLFALLLQLLHAQQNEMKIFLLSGHTTRRLVSSDGGMAMAGRSTRVWVVE